MEWKLGNGSIPGWSNNGLSAENLRVTGVNPFGIQTILWKCVPDATTTDNGGAAGGWTTSAKVLDKNYAYRYCVFVYKNKTGGTTYHGCQGVNNLDATANGNPYFWNGTLTPGQWYLMVGIIHPSSVTVQSGISGVYDMTGKKIASGTDYKFRTDGTNASFRSYLYYSYDTTVNQWFYNPMLYKLDGTEPSIEQLLQVSVRNEVDTVKTDYTAKLEVLNESITSKVTETKTYTDNAVAALQVGGRNLIKNSDFSNGLTNWSSGGTLAIDTSISFMGLNPLKYTGTSNAADYINLYQQVFSLLKPNTDYVLSCYAKYNGNQVGMFGLFLEGNKAVYSSLPTGTVDWKKYTLKFTTGATLTDQRVGWYFAAAVANTVTVWLTMFKLEEGGKVTDWSPSPDDQKTWVEQNYSTNAQTSDKIALEIGKVQIGGRNLILNSNNIRTIPERGCGYGSIVFDITDKDGGTNAATITFKTSTDFFRIGNATTGSTLKISGNTYTYSAFIYPVIGTQIKMSISALDPVICTLVVGKWQRISVTAKMEEGAWYDNWRFVDLAPVNVGDSFKIYHPQVEVGNKATDWSPSPDDLTKNDSILSSINLSQEAVKIKAALIALEGTVTANGNFKIRKDGIAEMKGAIVEGMIKALSGNIGDFSIVNGDIIGFDTSDIERVRLTTSAIPALASLSNVWEWLVGGAITQTADFFFRDSRPEEGDARDKSSDNYSFGHTFSLTSTGYIKISRAESSVTTDYSGTLAISVEDTIKIYQGTTLLATVQSDTPVYIGVTGTLTCVIQTSVSISNMPSDVTINLVVTQGYDGILKQKSSEKTMIGSNGFYSMFDISKFIYFNKDYGFDVQFGNSRLRLTASGIQKSSNGGTSWTSL